MSEQQNNTPGEAGWWDGSDQQAQDLGADDEAALDRLRALGDVSPDASFADLDDTPPKKRRFSRAKPASTKQAWGRMAGRIGSSGGGTNWGRLVARIAAPVVFLVAVIALVALAFQSGVIGSQPEPGSTPTPTATSTPLGAKGTTKVYVVKTGDTLSGIAVKFSTSISVLEELNPSISSSTLAAGARIKVPRKQ